MVWHLDRFGSSLKDLDSKMKSLEERRGPRLFDRGHRHHNPEKLTFNIFGALAEFEREVAREQSMAELEASRERRRVGGRLPALNDKEIPQLQAMMKYEEVSTSDICKRFDISRATLYRYVGPDGSRRRRGVLWPACRCFRGRSVKFST